VSVDSSEAEANGGSFNPSVSADGRYLVFSSRATSLVADDTNNTADVFVRDLEEGTTERVSVNSSGSQAEGSSGSADITCGRYVAFSSGATNLVEDDTNSLSDIFVRDRGATLPSDCIAPSTTASATTASDTDYTSGTWTREDVEVTFSAQDNQRGSGVEDIRYSATGAQTVPSTTELGDTASVPVITAEGTTTISYFATDNAGNRESPPKTFTVKIDKSAPTLDTDNPDLIAPDNKKTGVKRNIEPTAIFSDEMDPASVTDSANLYRWNALKTRWQLVPTAVSVGRNTVRLDPYPSDPSRLLAANKKFKVIFTTGAKNLAGIPLESPKRWTFTTGNI
jgi:hypothetical protein